HVLTVEQGAAVDVHGVETEVVGQEWHVDGRHEQGGVEAIAGYLGAVVEDAAVVQVEAVPGKGAAGGGEVPARGHREERRHTAAAAAGEAGAGGIQDAAAGHRDALDEAVVRFLGRHKAGVGDDQGAAVGEGHVVVDLEPSPGVEAQRAARV